MANTGNTQIIIDYGTAANDGTGDPLRTAFIKTDENFDNIWLAGPVGSNITVTDNTIQVNNTNGNLILKPNGVGVIQANAAIIPSVAGVRDLGSSSNPWRRLYVNEWTLPNDVDVGGSLSVNETGNRWFFDSNTSILSFPSGASWASDSATKDEFINSAIDGYITFTTYDSSSNEAVLLKLYHGLAQISIENGINYDWTFDDTGTFTAAGNINTSGNISGYTSITPPVALANLVPVAGARAFVNDGNLVGAGNFGAQIGSGGSNVVPVWSDGINWYVG